MSKEGEVDEPIHAGPQSFESRNLRQAVVVLKAKRRPGCSLPYPHFKKSHALSEYLHWLGQRGRRSVRSASNVWHCSTTLLAWNSRMRAERAALDSARLMRPVSRQAPREMNMAAGCAQPTGRLKPCEIELATPTCQWSSRM